VASVSLQFPPAPPARSSAPTIEVAPGARFSAALFISARVDANTVVACFVVIAFACFNRLKKCV
jgi:hypothetical protein